jgi:putative Holliday junction resolvase
VMEGTLIGFDFGSRRIGVAVGETSTRIASPLGAIEGEANEARFEAIGRIVDEWKPKGFVVGRPPRHPDGTEHAVARLAEKFGRRLEARYNVPVTYVDETLTSADAEASLRGMRTRAGSKSDVDALAATLILQSFLDEMPANNKEKT